MADCEVCGKQTRNCPPSPFTPCSYWRCRECVGEHRISWAELLSVLASRKANDFDSAVKEFNDKFGVAGYAEKYWLPTIEYFGKTKGEAWGERNNWEDEVDAEGDR